MASSIVSKVSGILKPKEQQEGYRQLVDVVLDFYLDYKDVKYSSMQVYDDTTARSACENLVNQSEPEMEYKEEDWAIVEHLVDLQLERTLEDHELVLQIYHSWGVASKPSTNKFRFIRNTRRYEYITNDKYFPTSMVAAIDPTNLCIIRSSLDQHNSAYIYETILKHQIPPVIYGEMERMQPGPNEVTWKFEHFVLEGGLLYHNEHVPEDPADKSIMEVHLEIALYDIYSVLDGPHKFKGRYKHYICLKRSKSEQQDEGADGDIHYFGCQDDSTRQRWITVMRMVKFGEFLFNNTEKLRSLQKPVGKHVTQRSKDEDDFVPMDYSSGTGRIVRDAVASTCRSFENMSLIGGGILTKVNASIHYAMGWFHPTLSFERATHLLSKHIPKDGVFVISERVADDTGKYALAYTFENRVLHHIINEVGYTEVVMQSSIKKQLNRKAYQVNGSRIKFYDLMQLVEFYHLNQGDLRTKLKHFIGPCKETALLNRITNYVIEEEIPLPNLR